MRLDFAVSNRRFSSILSFIIFSSFTLKNFQKKNDSKIIIINMNFPKNQLIACLICLLLTFTAKTALAGDDIVWRPVTPAELEMKKPLVEPDADAEAIFWEVRLDDKDSSKLAYNHYIRVKIFTEHGRERFSKFDIPFGKNKKVENVAARVIKPDGSIVELKPEDIVEREIIKAGKIKIKAKSFAVPGIEPGVIVEYQYKEVLKEDSASGERLIFQRDIPLQRVSYYVRPYSGSKLSYNFYNMPETMFQDDKKGYSVATMTNVPAFKQEPYSPPDDEVKRWVLLSYQNIGSIFNWQFLSEGYGAYFKESTKANKEIKQKAAELTAGAGTDDEKLRRIYDFTHRQIKNITFDRSFTDEQREHLKLKDADDALKAGAATSQYIDLLFASLARTAGFQTALVLSGDRSENFFNPQKYNSRAFVHPCCIAVKMGETWKYFNPGTPYLPYGKLLWNEELTVGMLVGDSSFVWLQTTVTDEKESVSKRVGKFKLLEDGTLEGTAKIEFGGQEAITRRKDGFSDSDSKRQDSAKDEIKRHIKSAEISEVQIENFGDDSLPLIYTYKVKVPNYAQKTGKRLFVQPEFFEYGNNAAFTASTRTNGIYFSFPWSEEDDIEIEMPKNFTLESPDAPAAIADPEKITSMNVKISVDNKSNKILYKRNFYFGKDKSIIFPVNAYLPLKRLFDLFHQSDAHTLTLKQTAVN